jgi:KTSC domain
MEWVEVQSSAIRGLGYDTAQGRLGIEFQEKRQVYVYYEVPHWEFKAFLAAESKGRYLTLVFLPRNYRCTGPYRSRRQAA